MSHDRAILRELLAKAAHGAAPAHGLALSYTRGHELSGIVHFELEADDRFVLTADDRRGTRQVDATDVADDAARRAIVAAVETSGVLDVESSSRPLGDDEQPILLELRLGAGSHALRLWAEDARASAAFTAFERQLWDVLVELSDGRLRDAP